MRTFLKWAAAALCLAACGGNVVVDTPGTTTTITTTYTYTTGCDTLCGGGAAGTGASTTSYPGSGGYTSSGTTTFPGGGGFNTTTYPGSGGSFTTTCTPCSFWLNNGSDGIGICGGIDQMAQANLQACACGGSPCFTSCGYNLCENLPVSAPCVQCLQSACNSQLNTCVEN